MTRAFAAILIILAVSACASPAYYYQAASGHFKLMKSRQDITAVLEDPKTRPAVANDLRFATDIIGFAEQYLGLPAGDSYETFVETGRRAVVWNVVANPEFSLHPKKWCFPVAGCVPYRGYFEQHKAERFAEKMRNRGLDVALIPATAYSTLGWFEDPLLDTMMNGGNTRLAGTIFHELAHQRLYLKGDTAFNESYASFMERAGISAWLEYKEDVEALAAWRLQRAAVVDFNALLGKTRQELSSLYSSGRDEADLRSAKKDIFTAMTRAYTRLKAQKWLGRDYFGGWFTSDINNARLALFASYEGGVCAFTRLYEETENDMFEFHRLARIRSELPPHERKKWLRQGCPAIASSGDL